MDTPFNTHISSKEPPVKRLAKVYSGHNSATMYVPAAWNGKYVVAALLPDELQEKAREQEASRQSLTNMETDE